MYSPIVFISEDLNMFVTVMICVAVKGKPVIGVINRPLDSDEYPKETGNSLIIRTIKIY